MSDGIILEGHDTDTDNRMAVIYVSYKQLEKQGLYFHPTAEREKDRIKAGIENRIKELQIDCSKLSSFQIQYEGDNGCGARIKELRRVLNMIDEKEEAQ
jgi:hypothetical protein